MTQRPEPRQKRDLVFKSIKKMLDHMKEFRVVSGDARFVSADNPIEGFVRYSCPEYFASWTITIMDLQDSIGELPPTFKEVFAKQDNRKLLAKAMSNCFDYRDLWFPSWIPEDQRDAYKESITAKIKEQGKKDAQEEADKKEAFAKKIMS